MGAVEMEMGLWTESGGEVAGVGEEPLGLGEVRTWRRWDFPDAVSLHARLLRVHGSSDYELELEAATSHRSRQFHWDLNLDLWGAEGGDKGGAGGGAGGRGVGGPLDLWHVRSWGLQLRNASGPVRLRVLGHQLQFPDRLCLHLLFLERQSYRLPDLSQPRWPGDFRLSVGGQSFWVSPSLLRSQAAPDSPVHDLFAKGQADWGSLVGDAQEMEELLFHLYPTPRLVTELSAPALARASFALRLPGLRLKLLHFLHGHPTAPLNWKLCLMDWAGALDDLVSLAAKEPTQFKRLRDTGFVAVLSSQAQSALTGMGGTGGPVDCPPDHASPWAEESGVRSLALLCSDGERVWGCRELLAEASPFVRDRLTEEVTELDFSAWGDGELFAALFRLLHGFPSRLRPSRLPALIRTADGLGAGQAKEAAERELVRSFKVPRRGTSSAAGALAAGEEWGWRAVEAGELAGLLGLAEGLGLWGLRRTLLGLPCLTVELWSEARRTAEWAGLGEGARRSLLRTLLALPTAPNFRLHLHQPHFAPNFLLPNTPLPQPHLQPYFAHASAH